MSNADSPMLAKYRIQNENFASGCFGKILLASDSSQKEVVIKKIPKVAANSSEVEKEIQAGKTLKHPNVVHFHEHYSDNEHDYLVFDRVHGNDLYSTIEKRKFIPFSDNEAKKIFKQILKSLQYCHQNHIAHRDIKLENILMDSTGKVTVIDFGLCDIVKPGHLSERFCGSIDYAAPEVLSRKSYNGFLADSFSLGVVLFTLLFAEFPFVSKDRVNALRHGLQQPRIMFNEVKKIQYKIDPVALDLISKMLRSDPKTRISLDEVKTHPWIRKPLW